MVLVSNPAYGRQPLKGTSLETVGMQAPKASKRFPGGEPLGAQRRPPVTEARPVSFPWWQAFMPASANHLASVPSSPNDGARHLSVRHLPNDQHPANPTPSYPPGPLDFHNLRPHGAARALQPMKSRRSHWGGACSSPGINTEDLPIISRRTPGSDSWSPALSRNIVGVMPWATRTALGWDRLSLATRP
jgi:hypothetical protein